MQNIGRHTYSLETTHTDSGTDHKSNHNAKYKCRVSTSTTLPCRQNQMNRSHRKLNIQIKNTFLFFWFFLFFFFLFVLCLLVKWKEINLCIGCEGHGFHSSHHTSVQSRMLNCLRNVYPIISKRKDIHTNSRERGEYVNGVRCERI